MEDDYGDGAISQRFYNNEISDDQKRIARRTRSLIESRVGRYSTLRSLVGQKGADLRGGKASERVIHTTFDPSMGARLTRSRRNIVFQDQFSRNSTG